MNREQIEKNVQEKGLNAPRLTLEHIKSVVKKADYFVVESTCLTVCVLTLENGFNVTGTSACASPENFNKELGEDIAFKKAVEQIWELEGYLLKQRLYEERELAKSYNAQTFIDRMRIEKQEIKTKINKLYGFLDNAKDKTSESMFLLASQGKAMKEYHDILAKRIQIATQELAKNNNSKIFIKRMRDEIQGIEIKLNELYGLLGIVEDKTEDKATEAT